MYMNKTPVAVAEGKDASGKLPSAEDEHVLVNIAKLSPALPEGSSGVHHPDGGGGGSCHELRC